MWEKANSSLFLCCKWTHVYNTQIISRFLFSFLYTPKVLKRRKNILRQWHKYTLLSNKYKSTRWSDPFLIGLLWLITSLNCCSLIYRLSNNIINHKKEIFWIRIFWKELESRSVFTVLHNLHSFLCKEGFTIMQLCFARLSKFQNKNACLNGFRLY